MRLATKFSLRFRSFFQRSRVEADLNDELQYHIQCQIAEYIAAGLSPKNARIAALRAMAGLELVKDKCRDTRGTKGMENMLQDFRFAFRTMRRTPGFTCLAIAALGVVHWREYRNFHHCEHRSVPAAGLSATGAVDLRGGGISEDGVSGSLVCLPRLSVRCLS